MSVFGDRVKRLLEKKDMTQLELAESVQTSNANISRYISSDREPRAEMALKIADALDTTVDYLYGRTNNPSRDPAVAASINSPDGYDSLSDEQRAQIQNLIDLFNKGDK